MIDIHTLRAELRPHLEKRIRRAATLQTQLERISDLYREGCENCRDWKQMVENIASGWEGRKPPLLIPRLPDSPGRVYSASLPSGAYRCLATDGSQILPSRHEIPDLALLQVARIAITYRSNTRPRLEKITRLLTPEQLETAMSDPFERPTFAQFVQDERDSAELEQLAALSAEYPAEAPGVALLDGTLVRWNLEDRASAWKALQLGRVREAFGRLRESGTPVVGYISRPGSRDVIHALAIYRYSRQHGRAPREPAEVLQANKEFSEAGDFGLEITDRLLFDRLLPPAQRSGWFASGSYVLRDYAPEDRILFCYLKTDSEVVRLEIPAWAEPHSETLHRLVLDQCRKGRGYPITLSEAHEQAVIRGPDRELFYRLASEEWMRLRRESGVPSPLPRPSPKQQRKRRPVL